MPPTAADRSRPPTPTMCDTPPPAAATRHATSCAPVPAAATIPTLPGGTTLANPRPTSPSIAVPHPGPMTSSPRSPPRRLSATSSSTETWSEKRKTCRPRLSARCASRVAYSPGTEMSATFAPPSCARGGAERARPGGRRRASAAVARAAARPPPASARPRRAPARPGRRRRRPRSRRRPATRRPARRGRRARRGSPACPSRPRTPRRRRGRAAPARCPSAARCRRSGPAACGPASSHRDRRALEHRRALGVGHDPRARPRRASAAATCAASVMIARARRRRRSAPRLRSSGPCCPAGNSPSSRWRSASVTVSRTMLALPRRAEADRHARDAGDQDEHVGAAAPRRARRRSGPCRSRASMPDSSPSRADDRDPAAAARDHEHAAPRRAPRSRAARRSRAGAGSAPSAASRGRRRAPRPSRARRARRRASASS